MEFVSLQDYLEAHKEEPEESRYFSNERKCTICNKPFHINNLIFLMGTKINNFGSMSMNLCKNCLPNWKKEFIKHRLISNPNEWHWSCWNLDKPMPHTEPDRVFLCLKNGKFFLPVNYNPSRRERNMISEEIR